MCCVKESALVTLFSLARSCVAGAARLCVVSLCLLSGQEEREKESVTVRSRVRAHWFARTSVRARPHPRARAHNVKQPKSQVRSQFLLFLLFLLLLLLLFSCFFLSWSFPLSFPLFSISEYAD